MVDIFRVAYVTLPYTQPMLVVIFLDQHIVHQVVVAMLFLHFHELIDLLNRYRLVLKLLLKQRQLLDIYLMLLVMFQDLNMPLKKKEKKSYC